MDRHQLRQGPKRLVKAAVRHMGYQLSRVDEVPPGTMESMLRRLAARTQVATVVDVGASDGRWSLIARESFPDAHYLLIEAQEAPHGEALRRLAVERSSFHPVFAAAGPDVAMIHFDAADPWSGVASTTPTGDHDMVVRQTTIDAEVARLGLPGPYLVKLDTHGYEVPILDGAGTTLAASSALIIEAYNFTLRPGALRFHELVEHVERQGFRPVDLVDPLWRPGDGVLWQFDLAFARADAPESRSDAYA